MYKEMVGTLDLRSHTSKSVIPERLSYTHLKKKKKVSEVWYIKVLF